jgi:uncharacterized protein YgiM (DUF1202 family)
MGWVLALLTALAADQDKKEEKPEFVVIHIEKTLLRERPSYSSKGVQEAKLGDTFKFVAWEGPWVKLIAEGEKVLYVHRTAVTDKKKYVAPVGTGKDGDSGDIAMATKGFSPQMEKEHKEKKNLHEAYAKLDRIEQRPAYLKDPKALDERLARFAQEGNLKQ